MNLILSIFLCLAMAFGGVSELPAVPESATTWTLRNLEISAGDQSLSLDPQARITTAVSADSASLHFELESAGRTLLPITAELTGGALRASFGSGDRVYSLSDSELSKLAELDAATIHTMDMVSGLLLDCGALLGRAANPEAGRELSERIGQAVIDALGAEIQPAEVELDDRSYPAETVELNLNAASMFDVLDAVADALPELGALMDSLLEYANSASGTDYASFSEAMASEGLSDALSLPVTVTGFEADELSYVLVDSSMSTEEGMSMQLHEEVTRRGEQTDVAVQADMANDEFACRYEVTGQELGPMGAPTETHLEFNMAMDGDLQVGNQGPVNTRADMRGTLDFERVDDLNSFHLQVSGAPNGQETNVEFDWTELREEDDSLTGALELAISQPGDEDVDISLELNRAEAEPVDYFAGAQEFPITADEINGDESQSNSLLMAALQTDAMQLYLDAMQLLNDPSVQEIAGDLM